VADYLLDLSRNRLTKQLVRQLKLPIPLPEPLARPTGPWTEAELTGRQIALGAARGGQLGAALKDIVTDAGGRIEKQAGPDVLLHGLLLDATGIKVVGDLGALYDCIKPRLSSLTPCSHVLLVGPTPETTSTPAAAAAAAALSGFVRSLSKELGRKGTTVQLLTATPEAIMDSARFTGPVRFFLSGRAAFISGQILPVTETVQAPSSQAIPIRPLADKIALVTGAAQGIGAEIARRFAAEGAKVIGLDRPQAMSTLEPLMQELDGASIAVDLLTPEAVRTTAEHIAAAFGHVDIIVNNAGMTRDKTLGRMPRDFWDDVLQVNLAAPIALTEAFVNGEDDLIKLLSPGGRVIFLSSVAGLAGNVGQTNYATAKAGLVGYTEALATRVAARGITVNALAPGFIETRMTKAMPLGVREVARRFNALGQAGQPLDVAEAAVFLASPAAYGITGAVLRVCGHNLIGA